MQAIMQQARVTVHTQTHHTAVVLYWTVLIPFSNLASPVEICLFLIILIMFRCFYTPYSAIFVTFSAAKLLYKVFFVFLH